MRGTILILDSVATNRILLKAKLAPGCYDLVQAASLAEARQICAQQRIDVIVAAPALPDGAAATLCQSNGLSGPIPVIVIQTEQDPGARLALLRAGVADVLVHPLDEVLMFARIRCLMRNAGSAEELQLRETTSRALGMAEAPDTFAPCARITIIGRDAAEASRWQTRLRRQCTDALRAHPMDKALARMTEGQPPDACVLELQADHPVEGLRLLADLRARPEMRHAAIIVVLDRHDASLAAAALDLGASDLMTGGFDAPELSLRLGVQLRAKRTQDRLRASVHDGLRAAVIDPLTGVYNRRYAMPHLDRLIARAAGSGRSLAVMMADLDHFKAVNDTHGHLAGDIVLCGAAQRLARNLRAVDLVARVGGEEFLIALPDTDATAAAAAGQRLCQLITGRPFDLDDGQTVNVSISIGITVWCAGSQPGDAWPRAETVLTRADRALFRAKGDGRNRAILAQSAA